MERKNNQPLSYEYLVALAKTLPSVPFEEITQEEKDETGSYYGNFHLFWIGLSDKRNDTIKEGGILEGYVKNVEEKYGQQWETFLQTNADVIEQIHEAIMHLKKPYLELRSLHLDLLKQERDQKEETQESKDFGNLLEGIYIYNNRILHPLYEKIIIRLEEAGFDPYDFQAPPSKSQKLH